MPGGPRIHHLKRNSKSQHFVCKVYGQLAFCTFQTNQSCMESLPPWEAGARTALEEITGSN